MALDVEYLKNLLVTNEWTYYEVYKCMYIKTGHCQRGNNDKLEDATGRTTGETSESGRLSQDGVSAEPTGSGGIWQNACGVTRETTTQTPTACEEKKSRI